MKKTILFTALLIGFFACQREPQYEIVEIDGIHYCLNAPDINMDYDEFILELKERGDDLNLSKDGNIRTIKVLFKTNNEFDLFQSAVYSYCYQGTNLQYVNASYTYLIDLEEDVKVYLAEQLK